MNARLTIAAALAIGGIASPVKAIEMFTNFNYGTELGTRPYGIEILSPVRYHTYQHGRWFQGATGPCPATGAPEMRPANGTNPSSEVPVQPPTASRLKSVARISSCRQRRPRTAPTPMLKRAGFAPPTFSRPHKPNRRLSQPTDPTNLTGQTTRVAVNRLGSTRRCDELSCKGRASLEARPCSFLQIVSCQ